MKKVFTSLLLVTFISFVTGVSAADKVPRAEYGYSVEKANDAYVAPAVQMEFKQYSFAPSDGIAIRTADTITAELLSPVADLRQRLDQHRWCYQLQEDLSFSYKNRPGRYCNTNRFDNFTAVSRINPQSVILLC